MIIAQIKSIEGLTAMHWLLAYAGLLVHMLIFLRDIEGPLFSGIKRRNVINALMSAILVAVLLILCTSTELRGMFPINYGTAFALGMQTQTMLDVVMKFSKSKKNENS